MPDSFAIDSLGILYVANGIDPMMRFDGFLMEAETAGVLPPLTAPTMTSAGAGAIDGTYWSYLRFVDRNGNYSSLSPLGGPITLVDSSGIVYQNVALPVDPKVVRRQILRNTDGQSLVFYIDVDTEDLTSTTLPASTRTDSDLQAEDYITLLDLQNRSMTDEHRVPPSDKKILAAHLDRLFLAGEEEYKEGCVSVTLGSTSVVGIGTEWPENLHDSFVGRYLWVDRADKEYLISDCNRATQTITLAEAYGGATSPYALYSIRPALAQRRTVAFSQPGLPESWPATNALAVQEDGDEIVGLMPRGSFLYILEHRHTYRLTFQEDPTTDGFVFLSLGRGCINNRCWVVVDDLAYLMDDSGVYSFTGGQDAQNLSGLIQDVFSQNSLGLSAFPYRLNYQAAARWAHASYDPGLQTIRWFVPLAGSSLPRHALCYDLQQKRWWIEEYPVPIGASCLGVLDGKSRVLLGGPAGEVYLLGEGQLDRIDYTKGLSRAVHSGTGTVLSLVADPDTQGGEYGANVVGAPVTIVSGRGKRQRRKIVQIADLQSRQLALDRPWLVLPDDTSTYQIGAVKWRFRTGWFRWRPTEKDQVRRLEIVFEPLASECTLDAQVYQDRARTPVRWEYTLDAHDSDGMASHEDETDLTVDLTKAIGFSQRRFGAWKENYIDGPRFVQASLDGATNHEPLKIHSLAIDGANEG